MSKSYFKVEESSKEPHPPTPPQKTQPFKSITNQKVDALITYIKRIVLKQLTHSARKHHLISVSLLVTCTTNAS